MKLSTVTKVIGKRGWLGVLLFAWGAFGFLTARSTANLLVNTPTGPDEAINAGVSVYYDGLANDLGYKSAEDYLTAKYRKEGSGEVVVGAALVAWGFGRYGPKKIAGEIPPATPPDKPAA